LCRGTPRAAILWYFTAGSERERLLAEFITQTNCHRLRALAR
jgi:hypothetical protein